MFAEFARTLKRFRRIILGWGIGLGAYSLLMGAFYSEIARIDISWYLDTFPKEFLAFFGREILSLSSPESYLDVIFFNPMIVIVGILAASMGAKLLTREKEDELILSYPTGRSAIFWGRALGYMTSLVIILTISWLSWTIPTGITGLELSPLEMARPFLPLLGQLALFGLMATLLNWVLPSSRMTSIVSGSLLVSNYLLVGLGNLNQNLEDGCPVYSPAYLSGGKSDQHPKC